MTIIAELLTVGLGADKESPTISTRVVMPRLITVVVVANRQTILRVTSVGLAFAPVGESVT